MPIDVAKEKLARERLTAGQLVDRYAEVHGEPTRPRNRVYLVRKILWKLQARELGELGSAARARAVELARGAELRTTLPPMVPPAGGASHRVLDPRVPRPGTTLTRLYKGHGPRTGNRGSDRIRAWPGGHRPGARRLRRGVGRSRAAGTGRTPPDARRQG